MLTEDEFSISQRSKAVEHKGWEQSPEEAKTEVEQMKLGPEDSVYEAWSL